MHPLPEDVTGFNTVQIVAKVRCEVRDGIRAYILGALSDPALTKDFPRALELADHLYDKTVSWRKAKDFVKLHGKGSVIEKIFERYNGGAIAYEFLFNITENNNISGGFDLLRTLSYGAVTGGVSGSATFDRNNMRTFSVADNFEDLALLFDSEYCGPDAKNGTPPAQRQKTDLLYPMAGALGLEELVGAFLNLNQSGSLVGLTNVPAQEAMLPTISESLKFTTTFAATGSVGFAASTDTRRMLRLAKASLANTNRREDIHTLRIVIKLPVEGTELTRTIAQQRLFNLGLQVPRGAKVADLVRSSALADLSLASDKEYLETKILVGQSARVLLPD